MLRGRVVDQGPVRAGQRRAQGPQRQALRQRPQDEDEGAPRGEALEHGRGHAPVREHRRARTIRREEHEAPAAVRHVYGLRAPDERDLAGVARAEGLVPEAEEGVRVQDGCGALGLEEELPGRSRPEESSEAEKAERSAVVMLKSECACMVLPGIGRLGGRAPQAAVAGGGQEAALARHAARGCRREHPLGEDAIDQMRRTRAGLGRKIAPCRRSSRTTPCTAWAGAGGCLCLLHDVAEVRVDVLERGKRRGGRS